MTDAEKISITKYDLYYESRMTKVESALESVKIDVKEIKTDLRGLRKEFKDDFKWLFIFMVGGFGGLFGLMAHGFKWF